MNGTADARKKELLEILEAAIAAVQPDQAFLSHFNVEDGKLLADGAFYELDKGRIFVAGAGKGAAPMAKAAEQLLGDKINFGLLAVKYGHALPGGRVTITEASHPVPDKAGEKIALEMLALAARCRPNDLLLCLFTGGASALLPAPAPGLDLADLQEATSLLLKCGANIDEINALRKHLSRIGGGQLAQAANGAHVIAAIVSDVTGDNLETIASGPTAPDPSTFADCMAIVKKYGLEERMPSMVMARLKAGARGEISETPKPDAPFFKNVVNVVVASNAQALAAAAARARQLGLEPRVEAAPLAGEAREAAKAFIGRAREIARSLKRGDAPICLLAGGETTVTIRGRGKGGRNQEMALAASLELVDEPGICALFAGTDGSDGPTDAAGGFAFADTAAKLDGKAHAYLDDNNSYAALHKADTLLITGPTLTNVMDIAMCIIAPEQEIMRGYRVKRITC